MPISSHALLPYVIQELETLKPKSVLDLGIGNGIYGALIYNYSPIFMKRIPHLVGVEVWPPYESPLWEIYDEIHIEDLRHFTTHQKFDMIIMMDVIEHMKLPEGEMQLKKYKGMLRPGGLMIVSTPAIFVPQDAYEGNTYEIHRSLWNDDFFKRSQFTPLRDPRATLLGEKMLIYKFKQEEQS